MPPILFFSFAKNKIHGVWRLSKLNELKRKWHEVSMLSSKNVPQIGVRWQYGKRECVCVCLNLGSPATKIIARRYDFCNVQFVYSKNALESNTLFVWGNELSKILCIAHCLSLNNETKIETDRCCWCFFSRHFGDALFLWIENKNPNGITFVFTQK